MSKADVRLLKPSRRRFLFMSAGIVAATSLMKISTAAQAFTTENMTFKATERMPDLGPMAMTLAGKDYEYDEGAQRWIRARAGTPNWRAFLDEEAKRAMHDALRESLMRATASNPNEARTERVRAEVDRRLGFKS